MSNKYEILIIVGARPQIMKAAALARAFDQEESCNYEIVHSGQHYDDNLSEQFFREFSLKSPKYQLKIGSKSHNIFIGEFLIAFDPILEEVNPDMVIVVGDTNTTAAAAIATAKRNIPLAHVEAGLREWDKSIPEEINKMLTDSVSDLYFSPTKTGAKNLVNQGVNERVYIIGDITLDLLNDQQYIWTNSVTRKHFNITKDYLLITCHRAATTSDKSALIEIINALNLIPEPIYWPLHPRTKNALETFNLQESIQDNVNLLEPLSFSETQSLIKHAKMVITDSGGIIKEAYFHSTPGIIIDHQTEWIETVEEGWNVITGPNCDKILNAYKTHKAPIVNKRSLGDGQAGSRIVQKIISYLKKK